MFKRGKRRSFQTASMIPENLPEGLCSRLAGSNRYSVAAGAFAAAPAPPAAPSAAFGDLIMIFLAVLPSASTETVAFIFGLISANDAVLPSILIAVELLTVNVCGPGVVAFLPAVRVIVFAFASTAVTRPFTGGVPPSLSLAKANGARARVAVTMHVVIQCVFMYMLCFSWRGEMSPFSVL